MSIDTSELALPFVRSAEQDALSKMIDDYVGRRWTDDVLHAALEPASARGPGEMQRLGSEMGLLTLTLPEGRAGGGAGMVEAAIVGERLGRQLAAVPYVSTVLVTELLKATDAELTLLEQIATADRIAIVVASDGNGTWQPANTSLRTTEDEGGFRLHGTAAHVLDADLADTFVVLATDAGGASELYLVDAGASGVSRSPLTALDSTRPQQTLHFDMVPATCVSSSDVNSQALLAQASDKALVVVAAEALGAAERLLDETVNYARTRFQFGRPIGSFQAVKHLCADVLVEIEQTRSLVAHAAWTLDHGGDDPELVVSLARVHAAETLMCAAAAAMQVFGGIGFTWEHFAHAYFKRAHADALLWGGLELHRDRIATRWLEASGSHSSGAGA